MLCPPPLIAFIGRVMRGEIDAVSSTLIRFSWTGYEREIDAVSSTLTRFSWTGFEWGDRCCVQHPYSFFLDGL